MSQQLVFVVSSNGALYEVDISTCSSTLIGYTGESFFDIAYCPNSGLLYGSTEDGDLYIIDQQDASLTYVGSTGTVLNALVCSVSGTLYGATQYNDNIYVVNGGTGWATSIGSTGVGSVSGGDLTFYNGGLYWSTDANEIVSVDISTPLDSYVLGNISGIADVYGIVSVQGCSQQVYASSGSGFYLLDMSTLTTSVACPFIVPGAINGAASTTETTVEPTLQPAGPFCVSDLPYPMQATVGGGVWSATCVGCINSVSGLFSPPIAGPGNWTVTYTHCGIDLTQEVLVQATTATLVPAGPFCISSAVTTLSASTSGGGWSGPGITNGVAGIFDPTAAGPGIHSITYVPAGPCPVQTSMAIEVLDTSNVAVQAAGPVCADAPTIALVAAVLGGTWSGNGIVNAGAGLFDPAIAGPGTHSVDYLISTSLCPSFGTTTIVVEPIPSLVLEPFGPFCLNEGALVAPVVLADLSGNGVFTYPTGWSTPQALGAGAHEIQYQFTATNTCVGEITIPFLVNDTTDISWTTIEACINASPVTLPSQVNGTGGDFFVDYGDGIWTGPTSTFDPDLIAAYPNSATAYQVRYVHTNALGCASINDSSIAVHPLPQPAMLAPDVCAGDPLVIANTSSIGSGVISDWAWSVPGQGDLTGSQIGPFVYSVAEAVVVTLEVTSDHLCVATTSETVVIHPLPVAGMVLNSGCQMENLDLLDQSSIEWGELAAWNWSFGDNVTSTTQNPSHSYANWGSFTVSLTVTSDFGCSSNATGSISIWPLPQSAFVTQPNCFGDTTTFQSLSSVPAGTIASTTWEFGDSETATGWSVQHLFDEPGLQPITLTTTSDLGCSSMGTGIVEIQPLPLVALHLSDTALCANANLVLSDASTIASPYSNVGWEWWLNGALGGTGTEVEVVLPDSGTYDVGLVVTTGNGCISSITVLDAVRVHPLPIAGFLTDPARTSILTPVITVVDRSQGGAAWYYTFGDGATATEREPAHIYETYDTFIVEQIVISSFGCLDTAYQEVIIDPDLLIYVPNAFSPNGDGVNDTFQPSLDGFAVSEYRLMVWDRWGEMIFETEDRLQPWNGALKDELVQEGVYIWQVDLLADEFVGRRRLRGHVTVLR